MLLALSVCAASLAICSPAAAQGGQKNDSVGGDTVDAITQPLSDLNLRSKDIPLILETAQEAPYDLSGIEGCGAVNDEIRRLEDVLGPDADAPPDKEGIINKGLKLGGKFLGGFIPFRGVVRQLSGANAERAKWQAAIYAGVARRSFLKGYARGLGCEIGEQSAVQTAEEVLGLKPTGE